MRYQIITFIILITFLLSITLTYIYKIKPLVVTSNSMYPTFKYGDVLLSKSQEHYYIDDIISFNTNKSIVTHRLVSIQDDSKYKSKDIFYETKGDANTVSDSNLIVKKQIIGKVIAVIPELGIVVLLFQSKLIIIFLSLVFLLSSFFYRKNL